MLVILDNGHAGIYKGRPQTPERRSRVFPNGSQLFEGEFNRAIVNGIIQELTFLNIPYLVLTPEIKHIGINERVQRANSNNTSDCFLVSVHSNTNPGTPGAGCEFLIHPNSNLGPSIANIFAEEYIREFPEEILRYSDAGEFYKKRGNLGILRRTLMPEIITENFFFNNDRETQEILLSREGRLKVIDYHTNAIIRVLIEVFDQELPFLD